MNKKSTMNSKSKYLNIGMLFYVLIFFFGVGFIGNITTTKAAPASYLIPADTAIPIDTTTPTAQPTTPAAQPSPTVQTTTPTAQPTSPAAQPTTPTVQPTPPATQPTVPSVVLPPPGPTNNTNVTPTPTATATSTATVTPTAVTIPSTTSHTPPTHNTTITQPGQPGSGNDAGPSVLGLSLGIGTPILLVFGACLFWLYLRRNRPGVAGAYFNSTKTSSWMSSNDIETRNGFPQSTGAFAANSSPASALYTTNPSLSSNTGTINVLEQTTLPPFAELAGPLYTPSDLRPITMNLSMSMPVPNPAQYPPTSDMSPLSLEALNLPLDIVEMMSPQSTPNTPISTTEMGMGQHHAPDLTQNSPALIAATTLPIHPPDVATDPLLENAMRQAQLGLFVIPQKKQNQDN